MNTRRLFDLTLSASILAGLLGILAQPSHAQEWPARQPIRVLVALTPGSAIDIVSRIVFEQVSRQIGQTIVIENRPGASQTLAAVAAAKADADGYTLLAAGSALAVVPSTMAKLPINVQTDLTAVGLLANVPLVMVVNPAKGYKTIHDFVAAAKAKPGSITYGSGGRGDATHLAAERFRLAAGFEGLYVPFKGAPEVLTEIIAGRLDFYMSAAAPAMPLIAGQTLQALAVASAVRAPALPDLPTTTELGFANADYEFWVGAFAPAATPRALVDRLNAEIVKALATESVRDRLRKVGGSPQPMTAQAFAEQFKREVGVNAALVKAVGLESN
ncbi:MAG: tripartite tricarboxylate transporter substrate binding protein [Xanthobacteraceae bacterium]|nr:tripartite tricarboxylate transporter substrate binding protein [Xanthobacteraceae bacterium]